MPTTVVPLGPATVDVTGVRAGDRNLFTVTIKSAGTPVDLTGFTVTAQARKTSIDVENLVAVVTLTDPTNGTITIRWPGDAVTTLLAGAESWAGVWDLQIDDGSADDPVTIVAGKFAAVMDVTRP